jgi:hypothetical protein
MKIEVRVRGLEDAWELRERAARRVGSQLRRFADECASVVVRIEDQNGPRGGVDKRCQIEVRGPRIGAALVEEIGADAAATVDVAAARAAQAVARRLGRAAESRNGTPVSGS